MNVEIKARVTDLDTLRARVQQLSTGQPQRFRQEDTFFVTPTGRMKLRVLDGRKGELISYDRADAQHPTPSTYQICPVDEPDELKRVLSASLVVREVVRKEREVHMIGRTRVHLDQVEGLGSFVELEVVLAPGESTDQGLAEAQELMKSLAVREEDLEREAYVDLIERVAG